MPAPIFTSWIPGKGACFYLLVDAMQQMLWSGVWWGGLILTFIELAHMADASPGVFWAHTRENSAEKGCTGALMLASCHT